MTKGITQSINIYNDLQASIKERIEKMGFNIFDYQGFKAVNLNDKVIYASTYQRLLDNLIYNMEQTAKLDNEIKELKASFKAKSDTVNFTAHGMNLERLGGLSCSIATAFRTDKNDLIYLTLSTDVKDNISIRFLFRLDNWTGLDSNISKDLNYIIEKYHNNKVVYNEDNIIKLLNELGATTTSITFDLEPHNLDLQNNRNLMTYNIGN